MDIKRLIVINLLIIQVPCLLFIDVSRNVNVTFFKDMMYNFSILARSDQINVHKSLIFYIGDTLLKIIKYHLVIHRSLIC